MRDLSVFWDLSGGEAGGISILTESSDEENNKIYRFVLHAHSGLEDSIAVMAKVVVWFVCAAAGAHASPAAPLEAVVGPSANPTTNLKINAYSLVASSSSGWQTPLLLGRNCSGHGHEVRC